MHLVLHTTCVRSWCNWRASCVASPEDRQDLKTQIRKPRGRETRARKINFFLSIWNPESTQPLFGLKFATVWARLLFCCPSPSSQFCGHAFALNWARGQGFVVQSQACQTLDDKMFKSLVVMNFIVLYNSRVPTFIYIHTYTHHGW